MKYDSRAQLSQELESQVAEFQKACQNSKSYSGRNKDERLSLERDMVENTKPLLEESNRHLVYHELCWKDKETADELRSQFASTGTILKVKHSPIAVIWNAISRPGVNMDVLLPFSAWLSFSLALDKPYLSRDENLFYIIDNPVRREKVYGHPYVAASGWKGSLRSALRFFDSKKYSDEKEITRRLFGNERGTVEQGHLRSGRLIFYPTFFDEIGLEVINPHDRATRAGRQPIYLESAPVGARGVFTLLYIPFDRIGLRGEEEERQTVDQVGEDLQAVALGLRTMLTVCGFGAKTTNGFGLAKDSALDGKITIKFVAEVMDESVAQLPEQQTFPRYLEAPNRLKAEFRNEDGSFRERSIEEISRLKKTDKQLYEKARNWWDKEGKALDEVLTADENAHESSAAAAKPKSSYYSRQFNTFVELEQHVEDCANLLKKGGVRYDRKP